MTFSADWLALREPADHAARDAGLRNRAARWLRAGGADALVVDLGCGTGSTRRGFGAALPPSTRWRLIDNDAALLRLAAADGPAETVQADLDQLDSLPLGGARLVTASALLDLVSCDWLAGLAARLAGSGAGLYAALSYDGAMEWHPALPDDPAVTAAFNTHQCSDKGFGPALGPGAGPEAARLLAAAGFEVAIASSPWRLGPDQADLQRQLVAGIAAAAAEAGCAGAADWAQARAAACGYTACSVGHVDLLALPRG